MDRLVIAGKSYGSRLLVGTGRYKSMEETKAVIEASGAEIITVAVRRVNVTDAKAPRLQDVLDPEKYTYLPNSAGCYTAEDALRVLRLAREMGGWTLVKLEVIGDEKTLYPDAEETLKASKILVAEGFEVMAYTNDDPIMARKLEDAGCVAVMPLGAPIGSGLGLQNPLNIELIVKNASVPVLVDAGVGTASDACIAMELGCSAVLMNTALYAAEKPVEMANAMKLAVESGRMAYLAGRMPKREHANPSSPVDGVING
jgi:thiazole synthase